MAIRGPRPWNQIDNGPYVHSYTTHINFLSDIFRMPSKWRKEGERFEKLTFYLRRLSDALRQEAIGFLGKRFNDSASYSLYDFMNNGEAQTFSQIGQQVLDSRAIAELRKLHLTTDQKKLNELAEIFGPKLVEEIGDNIEQFHTSREIAAYMVKTLGSRKATENIEIGVNTKTTKNFSMTDLSKIFFGKNKKNLINELVDGYQNAFKDYINQRKKEGRISREVGVGERRYKLLGYSTVTVMEKFLRDNHIVEEQVLNPNEAYVEQFINIFRSEFNRIYNKLKSQKKIYIGQYNARDLDREKDNYLEQIFADFRGLRPEFWQRDDANWKGSLKETGFSILVNLDINSPFKSVAVGSAADITITSSSQISNLSSSEKRVLENILKQNGAIEKIGTFRAEGTQSPTDLILQNEQGKTIRVQSKNYIRSFWSFFSEESTWNTYMGIYDTSMKLEQFLNKMMESPQGFSPLGAKDANIIKYLAANTAYFLKYKYFDLAKLPKIKNMPKPNLDSIIGQLNDYIGLEAQNLIGMNIDTALTPTKKFSQQAIQANAFYMVPGLLIPVYKIVDELIARLSEKTYKANHIYKNNIRFQTTLKYKGFKLGQSEIQFARSKYPTAGSHSTQKHFNPAAGYAVGRKIVDSIYLERQNIVFNYDDLKELAQSSLMFTMKGEA